MKRLIIILIYSIVYGANGGTIKGLIQTTKGQALDFATVALYKLPDSTRVAATLSDENGAFQFEKVKPGLFFVSAQQLGYTTQQSGIISVEKNTELVQIPTLILSEASISIDEVQVVATRPMVEVQSDKTVVNVEQGVMNAGISAAEILKRSPGVSVDKDGAVSLKGRDGVLVMLNGKPLYMDDNQIGVLLRSLPADQIKNIEIMTNPSSKYDAAGNAGIININLKKGALEGMNGAANTSYGQGFYPKAGAGVNINYRHNKVSLSTGYQLQYRQNLEEWTVDRRFGGTSSPNRFYTFNSYNAPGVVNNANAALDYELSPRDMLSIQANGNFLQGQWNGGNTSSLTGADGLIQENYRSNERSIDWNYMLNAGLGYKHKFDTSGTELSVTANINRYDQRNSQNITTGFYAPNGTMLRAPFRYTSRVPVLVDQVSVQSDFIKPFSKTTKLEMGAKYVSMNSISRIRGEANLDNTFEIQENYFDYQERIMAGYISGSHIYKKFNFNAGLRYEHTVGLGRQISQNLEFTRNYGNLFPNISITFNQSDMTSYTLGYSKRIDRPEYNQLNPFVYYSDPFNLYKGNQFLLPQLTDNVEFTYSLFYGALTTGANYGFTRSPIGDIYQIDANRVTTWTQSNLSSFESIGAYVALNMPLTKWWTTSNYVYVYQNIFKSDIGFGERTNSMVSFMANSTQNFKLPHGISMELAGVYEGPSAYSISRYQELWQVSAGIQKSLWNDVATIKLAIQDMFWTYVYRGETQLGDTKIYDSYRWDNRIATLTFTYNFGKKFSDMQPIQKTEEVKSGRSR